MEAFIGCSTLVFGFVCKGAVSKIEVRHIKVMDVVSLTHFGSGHCHLFFGLLAIWLREAKSNPVAQLPTIEDRSPRTFMATSFSYFSHSANCKYSMYCTGTVRTVDYRSPVQVQGTSTAVRYCTVDKLASCSRLSLVVVSSSLITRARHSVTVQYGTVYCTVLYTVQYILTVVLYCTVQYYL
jgi:hypothetical protein